jgi:hypothetical protein
MYFSYSDEADRAVVRLANFAVALNLAEQTGAPIELRQTLKTLADSDIRWLGERPLFVLPASIAAGFELVKAELANNKQQQGIQGHP